MKINSFYRFFFSSNTLANFLKNELANLPFYSYYMTTKLNFLLIVLTALLWVNNSQYVKRSLEESFPIFKNYYFTYQRTTNAQNYTNWTIATDIGLYSYAYNRDVLYTSTLYSISSNINTKGFEIQPEVTFLGASNVDVSIVNSAINQLNQAFVWYSVRFLLFMVPKQSPIKVQTVTAMIYSTLGSSLYTMTNSSFPLQFSLSAPFYDSCFYDSAKTIKDKIHLAPALTKVNIENPNYINLTSHSNWEYGWNSSMLSVDFEVRVSSYISQALYVVVQVIGMCPNSYMFTNLNYSISIGSNNWFEIPADTSGQTLNQIISLSTPLSNGTMLMKGMSITGLSLHNSGFPATFISFNITPHTNANNTLEATSGDLSFYSLMPQNGYVNYWAMGYMGACPTNFATYNSTHCYCNPAQNLTFDAVYSTGRCRPICLFGYFFSYAQGICKSCQIVFSYLCSTCNATVCFNCTNGLQYYQPFSSSAVCLDCISLYGSKCLYCSDRLCLNCTNEYISTLASPVCSCQGQRYPSNNTCLLCNGTFLLCLTCTPSGCLKCDLGYKVSGGQCVCDVPDLVINGSCYNCSQLYGSTCIACDQSTCTACVSGLVLSAGSCLNCSVLLGSGCTNCDGTQCLLCTAGYILGNGTCLNCTALFGSACTNCDASQCLVCISGYILSSGACFNCTALYGQACMTCDGSQCLYCISGYIFSTGGCYNCTSLHGQQCTNCDAAQCLSCIPGYILTNGSCYNCTTLYGTACASCNNSECLSCTSGYNLSNGACLNCNSLFGSQCSNCDASQCLSCISGYILTNGSCFTCTALHGNSCTSCDASSCLSCVSDFILTAGVCLNCTYLFGQKCINCNATQCLSCDSNFSLNSTFNCTCFSPSYTVINSTCTSCTYQLGCLTCTNTSCLSCEASFSLANGSCQCPFTTFLNSTFCETCSSIFPHCVSCNYTSCHQCRTTFILSSGNCTCDTDRYIDANNSCILCSSIDGCLQCIDVDTCTLCNSSLTLTNGICSCPPGLVNSGGYCYDCLTLYGVGCSSCDNLTCLSCETNFIVTVGRCECPSPSFVIISNQCQSCSSLYSYCQTCNNNSCLSCNYNRYLTNNTCLCQTAQYQALNGSCTDCLSSYVYCLDCSWERCYNCEGNYTIENEECGCRWPMVEYSSNCVKCQDAYSKDECTLSASIQTFQSGDSMYFWIKFNKPENQVSQLVPLQQNIKVSLGGSEVPFIEIHSKIFQISVLSADDTSLMDITVQEPSYISYQHLTLGQQPAPFNLTIPTYLLLDMQMIDRIFKIRNYFNLFFGVLSFGVFNRMFQESTIICLITYPYSALPHSLGSVLDSLNKHSIYQPLLVSAPFEDRYMPVDQLRLAAYGLNRPISNLSFQLLALLFLSLLLMIYVRGYLSSKRNPRRHKAFKNILEHSTQYMLENWICGLSLLAFPSIYQLKIIVSQGLSNLDLTNGANLILSMCLLFAPICLIVVYFFQFSPTKRRYSILYRQLKSEKALATILYLLTLFRPFSLAVMGLMLSSPFSQYFLLTYNFLHFFLVMICTPFCLSLLSHILLLIKSLLSIYINTVLLFGNSQSILLKVAAYSLVLLVLLEMLEAIIKLVRLILRNKGIIDDSYKPIKEESEEAFRQSQEKKKQLTNKMMSYLTKARDELGQLLQKRKRRNVE